MAKDRIESKYVTVAPGVELHILEKGEGKPLVFIPGLTFSGEIFKNQLEYFSSEYRVIAIDPRGQGYSAKTVDGNDYLTHGRDVAGLIDALGLKDIVLIGWSTGNLDTWSYVQQFGKYLLLRIRHVRLARIHWPLHIYKTQISLNLLLLQAAVLKSHVFEPNCSCSS